MDESSGFLPAGRRLGMAFGVVLSDYSRHSRFLASNCPQSGSARSRLTAYRLPEGQTGSKGNWPSNRKKPKQRYPTSGSRAARAELPAPRWSVSVTADFSDEA